MKVKKIRFLGILSLLLISINGWGQCTTATNVIPVHAVDNGTGSSIRYVILPGRSVNLNPQPLPSGYLFTDRMRWRKNTNTTVATTWTYSPTSAGEYLFQHEYEVSGGGGGDPSPQQSVKSIQTESYQWYNHACVNLTALDHQVSKDASTHVPSARITYTANVVPSEIPTVKWFRNGTLVTSKSGSDRFTFWADQPGDYHARGVFKLVGTTAVHEVSTAPVTILSNEPCLYLSAGPNPIVPGLQSTITSRFGQTDQCRNVPSYDTYRWVGPSVVTFSGYNWVKVNQPGTYSLEGQSFGESWTTLATITIAAFTGSLTESGSAPFKTLTYTENVNNLNPVYDWRNQSTGTGWLSNNTSSITTTDFGVWECQATFSSGGNIAMHSATKSFVYTDNLTISGALPNATLTHSYSVTGGMSIVPTYKWYFDDVLQTELTTSSISVSRPGKWRVKATFTQGAQSLHKEKTVFVNPPSGGVCMELISGPPTISIPGLQTIIRINKGGDCNYPAPDYIGVDINGNGLIDVFEAGHLLKNPSNQDVIPVATRVGSEDFAIGSGTYKLFVEVHRSGEAVYLPATEFSPLFPLTYSISSNGSQVGATLLVNTNAAESQYARRVVWQKLNQSTYSDLSANGNSFTTIQAGTYRAKIVFGFDPPGTADVVWGQEVYTNSISISAPPTTTTCFSLLSGPPIAMPGISNVLRFSRSNSSDCSYPSGLLLPIDNFGNGASRENAQYSYSGPDGGIAGTFVGTDYTDLTVTQSGQYLAMVTYRTGDCPPPSNPNTCQYEYPDAPVGSYNLDPLELSLVASSAVAGIVPPGADLGISTNAANYIHTVKWYFNNQLMSDYNNQLAMTAHDRGHWRAEVIFKYEEVYSDPVFTNFVNVGFDACISTTNDVVVAVPGMTVTLSVVTDPSICDKQPLSFIDNGRIIPFEYYFADPYNYRAPVSQQPDGSYSINLRAEEGNYKLIAVVSNDNRSVYIASFYLPPLNMAIYANGEKTENFQQIPLNSDLSVRATLNPTQVRWFRNNQEVASSGGTISDASEGLYYALATFQQGIQEVELRTATVLVGSAVSGWNSTIIEGPPMAIPGMFTRLQFQCGETQCSEYLWRGTAGNANNLPDTEFPGHKVADVSTAGDYIIQDVSPSDDGYLFTYARFTLQAYKLDFLVNNEIAITDPTNLLYTFRPDQANTPLQVSYSVNVPEEHITAKQWFREDRLVGNGKTLTVDRPGNYNLLITYTYGDQVISLSHPFKIRSYALLRYDDAVAITPVNKDDVLMGNIQPLIAEENPHYADSHQQMDPQSVSQWYKDGIEYTPPVQTDALKFNATEPGVYMAKLIYPNGHTLLTNEVTINNRPLINRVTSYAVKKSGLTDENQVLNGNESQVSKTIQYMDGFGRPLQTVNVKSSPGVEDVATINAYDVFGREIKKYLPFVRNTRDGKLRYFNPDAPGNSLLTFYQNGSDDVADTDIPYTESQFENSPLNRLVRQSTPGVSIDSVNVTSFDYGSNESGVVKKWTLDSNGQLVLSGFYGNGQLTKVKTTDENGNISFEYKDKLGMLILIRKVNVENNVTQFIDTYSVYNSLGQLLYVLPPNLHTDN